MSRYFRLMNRLHINKQFHRITPFSIDTSEEDICSPVEAHIEAITHYTKHLCCTIKNKPISLDAQLGSYTDQFIDGTVCSCYLAPSNKHFWILPATGTVVYTQRLQGQAKRLKTILGAEKLIAHFPRLRHHNLLQAALRRNCTDTTILQTNHGLVAMIAVGSLGVNHIYNYLEKGETYTQGTLAGYFALGSSMLLILSKEYLITKSPGKTTIGEKLGTSSTHLS